MQDFYSWLSSNLVALVALVGGIGSAWRWLDGRSADRATQREKRYWELLDIANGRDEGLVLRQRQIAALLLLPRYREFRHITIAVLNDATEQENSPWTKSHEKLIRRLLAQLQE